MPFNLSRYQFPLQALHDAFALGDRQPDGSRADLILTFNTGYFALQRLSLPCFSDQLNLPFHAVSLRHRPTLLHALVADLKQVRPVHVAAYIEALTAAVAKPTVKQHLAAIRMLLDWLVVGHVLEINPAHAVWGPKHVVKKGRTPVLTSDEARAMLAAINTGSLTGPARSRPDRHDNLTPSPASAPSCR